MNSQQMCVNDWPAGGHDQGVLTSGINCLLVLLKEMLAKDESAASTFEDNAFLQHARKDLSDPLTASQALTSLVTIVWDKPLSSIPTSELSFAGLLSSPVMAPFWSAPFCHPWRLPVWKWEDDAYWFPVGSAKTPAEVMHAVGPLIMSPCAFKFKATPGMRLADIVSKRFGWFGDQGVQVFFPNQPSDFFYATFKVYGVDGENRLSFNAFRTISFGIKDPTIGTPVPLLYNLLAIVKHAREGGGDTIRVYNGDGSAKHNQSQEYANPTWQMADLESGDSFFTVYAKSHLPPRLDPPFPEIAAQKTHVVRGSQKRTMIKELFTSLLHGYSDLGSDGDSDENPDENTSEVFDENPDGNPDENPNENTVENPDKNPGETVNGIPDENSNKSPNEILGETVNEIPSRSPVRS